MTYGPFEIAIFFVLLILAFVFFNKDNDKNIETKIYARLLVITICFLAFSIFLWAYVYFVPNVKVTLLLILGSKLINAFYLLWIYTFASYIFAICNVKRGWYTFLMWTLLAGIVSVMITDIHVDIKNRLLVSQTGLSNVLILVYILFITIFLVYFYFKNHKNIKSAKKVPFLYTLIMCTIFLIVSYLNPSMFLVLFSFGVSVLMMYFTIENPDSKALARLQLANDRFLLASRVKQDFLSSMNHEIRTPLNAIIGLSESMYLDDNLPEDYREDARDIFDSANELMDMFNNIFASSTFDISTIKVEEFNYNLNDTLKPLCEKYESRCNEKEIKFVYSIDKNIPDNLLGDNKKIKEIIDNLLSNALKYTEKGEIDLNIKSSRKKGNVCCLNIEVNDTGKGIPANEINNIFRRFQKSKDTKNGNISGIGLGLSVTKSLVELLNGTIKVNSIEGVGTKFTVTINQKICK